MLLFVILLMLASFSAVSAQDEGAHFAGGWPYQTPPDGHFNVFVTNNLNLGIYYDLMNPPQAIYHWGTGEYEGVLAESFGYDADNNYTVTLKEGVTWSDGTPLTAQDVVTTFNIGYLLNWSVWKSLSGVEAVDDQTVQFTVTAPSGLVERQLIVEPNIAPTSVYGDIAARAGELVAAGAATGDEDFDALLAELTEFRPETFVASGPFMLDPDSITAANLTLVKNEGGYNADVVRFDSILLWNGETEAVTPLVSSGEMWYGTYGFPPATEAAFIDAGIDIIRGPGRSGPGIYVNHDLYPLNVPEVRQAMAYVINREENGFVSLGESGVAVECMCGMSDQVAPLWLSEDTLDSLNYYDFDTDAATELLEGLGFSKGGDGIWVDDQGNPLAFELIFPAEYADWSAAAENAIQQLNAFGFNITGRGVQFQQQEQDVYDSNFQMAIRDWGASSPFPSPAYLTPYQRYNGQGLSAGDEVGGGMKFNPDVSYSGGELNVYDATIEVAQGLDEEAQRALAEQLAVSYNELLPAIPLWERYANNPLNREFLDAPASDDTIYLNPWSGNDAFMPYLITNGLIGPAA